MTNKPLLLNRSADCLPISHKAISQCFRGANAGWTSALLIGAFLLGIPGQAQSAQDDAKAFRVNEQLGRGINIPSYEVMNASHFQVIKDAGFQNVRIPIHPFSHTESEENFQLKSSFFETLDSAVDMALKNDLMPIIDLHEHHAMQKDPVGRKPMFLAVWKQLAEHYQDSPENVLFEIANEPNMKPELWNEIHRAAHDIIRKSNPDRILLFGSIYGNQISFLKDLELPVEDRNIIVTIHYYSPKPFTHQGAEWSAKNRDLSGIEWPNKESGEQAIINDFDVAVEWSKSNNRPLHLGEFGVYQKAGIDSRVRWTNFVARQAEARNWSWSYWEFSQGFGVYNRETKHWKQGLLDALTPENNGQNNLTTSGKEQDSQSEEIVTNNTKPSLGVFASHDDVGEPAIQGEASYDPITQSYTVAGAGKNMWFDKDEFHFVSRKINGDFILRTRAHFIGEGSDPHRKLGWMIRSTLETDSPHINAVVHGDGLTSLQWRPKKGEITEELQSELTGADVVQLERRGNRYTMSVARFGEPFVVASCDDLELGDSVHVGLFVCSHNPEVMEKAIFKDVRINVPAAADFAPYRDYIGSRLETLDVDTGDRRVLFETTEPIEAPNWTPDGNTMIYNSRGKLYRFPLDSKTPSLIDTGFADRCNNDHVLSFDGLDLAISHHSKDAGGASMIYTLPVGGGEPKQVTTLAPSYLHGWSPDRKFLIYTAQRNNQFDIYRIRSDGGEELRLTAAEGLDDGSEYSPDGKYIYFNSARTGTMQIWRMNSDGSDQQQLTNDQWNNWFPHVSPDGKRMVFISFSKEIAADQHPFYQHVYLRSMSIEGGPNDEVQPQIVAYVYGGQGTINVPSWSPDSRHVAFVSNTDAL